MYVLITDRAVYTGRTPKAVAKKSGLAIADTDYQQRGRDQVAMTTDHGVQEILTDARRIENAVLDKLFKPDALSFPNLLQIGILIGVVILLAKS